MTSRHSSRALGVVRTRSADESDARARQGTCRDARKFARLPARSRGADLIGTSEVDHPAARTHARKIKTRRPTASTWGPTTNQSRTTADCFLPLATTSTVVSPGAATASTVLTSASARLLDPHEIAGHKIDSACPNHPRSARARRRPSPPCGSAVAHSWCLEEPDKYRQYQLPAPTFADRGSS